MGLNDKYKIVGLHNKRDKSIDCPFCINDAGYVKVIEIHNKDTIIVPIDHYICMTCGTHLKPVYQENRLLEMESIPNHYGVKLV